ncbi:MAG: DNA gyrase subunit B [Planctomycetes bacterium]|nr:DNA gyrase subunit B [Planctomycetota bacterium]MCB9891296.1 DNA gyrase subunit B [Planctomycetota bacterium]MCB9919445.1 DNA gyrase subunit B [Planctomycetota bacterium]
MSDEHKNEPRNENDQPKRREAKYDEDSIQVLEGLEAVRKRPAMYIGDTSSAGLHHLIWEVVDNSVDEALQQRCSLIIVTLHKDGSVSVLDDGAGIPTGRHPKLGIPTLEVILTKLHAGGKFDKGGYQVSGGLHGVGVSVVNALSEWLEATVYRDGKIYRQTFARGKKSIEMEVLGETTKRGTLIRFMPDSQIFETDEIRHEVVHKRLRELAYLMGTFGLTIELHDERDDTKESLRFENGLVDFVHHLNKGKQTFSDEVVYINRDYVDETSENEQKPTYGVEIALQYNDGFNENLYSFVNNINTHEGGTHLSGFKTALTRTLNAFAKKNSLLKDKDKPPSGDDLREGLTAVISVKVPDPQFESQTKIRLGNREVEGIVNTIFGEGLRDFLEERPKLGKSIFEKALQAARAREAARKARDTIRRKSAMENSTLPLKLVDCHRGTPRSEAELFLVEGDSAGGTAVSGRASFQAVLPLRGKILNVEKAPIHKVMDHKEIEAIVTAVGTGFLDEEFDEEKLRYSKIVIMTDADVDGSHIRTLLLTFFYRKMPELVKRGHVYVAQPPLYMIRKGEKYVFVHTEAERERAVTSFGADTLSLRVGEQEWTGAELQSALDVLRQLKRSPLSQTMGLSDLISRKNDAGKWPTHRLRLVSDRVRASHKEGSLYLFGGERELEDVLKSTRDAHADARISMSSEVDKEADIVVETIHIPARLDELLAKAASLGLPLHRLDRTEDGNAPEDIHTKAGSEQRTASTLFEALERYSQRRDLKITRFKGLGEMDAEQLWESAMDPARRLLYRVGFADEVETDNLFTVLMGSVVEPRREFIEKHSLEVTNLDV